MPYLSLDSINWQQSGNYLMPLYPPKDLNYPAEALVLEPTVYGYDDQYTGSLNATPLVATPVVAAVDSQTGTSAVVTVTGSDVGTSNEVFISWWGQNGVLGWESAGTISGDGSLTVNYPVGLYAVRVQSSLAGHGSVYALGNLFYITNGTNICRNRIRDSVANSTLKICMKLGFQADYQSPGRSSIKVWCIPENQERGLSMLGGEIGTSFSVLVPRQADFPPVDGLVPGARLGVAGKWFGCDVTFPAETIDYAPTFTFQLHRLDDITVEVDGTDV